MCICFDLCTPDSVCQILRTCFISEAWWLAGIDEMKWHVCVCIFIGTFFRWAVSPEDASAMHCFVLSICDNGNIFVTVDRNSVVINLYQICKQHLHKCFSFVPSSGD
jgi:hypothetical protein